MAQQIEKTVSKNHLPVSEAITIFAILGAAAAVVSIVKNGPDIYDRWFGGEPPDPPQPNQPGGDAEPVCPVPGCGKALSFRSDGSLSCTRQPPHEWASINDLPG